MAEKSDFSLATYILGIISIVLGVLSPIGGIVIGIIGLSISRKDKTDLSLKGRKLSWIGIVVGLIFLILSLLLATVLRDYLLSNIPSV